MTLGTNLHKLKRILITDFYDVALSPGLKKRQSNATKRKLFELQRQVNQPPSDGSGIGADVTQQGYS
ncbi:uncharacterized protein N7479_010324 [Penicillium vulpinum]|uniref:uncharacterized protein n=1 Tax=Penicillium vulpinum TaxID=29845 RepID=UPI002549A678|nr:uncharacterized protein N7479_010324 [Penicillium vulpinum]KAJ5951911.1 hypothetical protein N7479_010324 [Penicillium vulpinum]